MHNVNILGSGYTGIYVGSSNLENVVIESSFICYSATFGIKVASSHIALLNVSNCSILENRYGVNFDSLSGSISIEDTKISNSTSHALYINVPRSGGSTYYLTNSSLTHCKGLGIVINGYYGNLRLVVTGTFFGWNNQKTVYSDSNVYSLIATFTNNTFFQNTGPVVYFGRRSRPSLLRLENNIFDNNTEPSVVTISSGYLDKLTIRKNEFTNNECHGKGIIHLSIPYTRTDLIIEDNVFERNNGRTICAHGSNGTPLQMVANIFRDNNCSNKGIVEIRRMERDITITHNVFNNNEGHYMILLQSVHNIQYGMVIRNLTFENNSFIDNKEVPSQVLHCEVNISGLLEYKAITINQNKFTSKGFSKELCVNVFAPSQARVLDASLNYWGYENVSAIRGRIYDRSTNYEMISVHFSPFINSKGIIVDGKNQTEKNCSERHPKKDLGGYISNHVRLESNSTLYLASSNIIILSNASLTITPGVEIQFGPSVSIVVFGSLFALGSAKHRVKFTVLKKARKKSPVSVRLIGGKYPWIGRLEVAHSGIWAPAAVCVNDTGSLRWNDAAVVCRQLGYESPWLLTWVEDPSNTRAWRFNFSCFGSETDISKCPITFENIKCNPSYHVMIGCRGGLPWGNVRFMRDSTDSIASGVSILEHLDIEHCGYRSGQHVPAVQAIHYVPKINHVRVVNCSSGGLKVLYPEKEFKVAKSSFINTGGNGTEIVGAKSSVTFENIISVNNENGVTFTDTDAKNLEGLFDGQISLCAKTAVVNLTRDEVFLFFKVQNIDAANPSIDCKNVIFTDPRYALSLKLLVQQRNQYLRIIDRNGRAIIETYNREERRRLEDQLILPWNRATIILRGSYDGEVLLHVRRVRADGE